MDLLALVTTDSQLHLHRLNWQRLWSMTPESPIKALCWRPDGKQLAIGQENGTVAILSAEDGVVQEQYPAFTCQVAALAWTHTKDARPPAYLGAPVDDRDRRLFEPLLPTTASGAPQTTSAPIGFVERLGRREDATWPVRLSVLSVLACVSVESEVALLSNGTIPILRAPFFSPGSGALDLSNGHKGRAERGIVASLEDLHISHVALPADLKEVSMVFRDGDGAVHAALLETPRLPGNLTLLRALSSLVGDIRQGVTSCNVIAAQMAKDWESVTSTRDQVATDIVRLYTDFRLLVHISSLHLHNLMI